MQGSAEKQSQVPTARRFREGSRWPRGAPPAAGGGTRPHSFNPRGWANTATCLRPRHQKRKSRLPSAAAAGKTRAGVRLARAHKAAAMLSPSQLGRPASP